MSIRRFLGVFAAALALAGSVNSISLASATAAPPVPGDDPFYAQPHSLSGRSMGEVIDSRPVDLPNFPTSARFSAWQLKYVSQNSEGSPWTTMATVLRPADQAGPSALLVYDPWIDAVDPRCSPSYQIRADTDYQTSTGMRSEFQNIGAALDRGWTVVIPDYLGPDGEFAAGKVEGRNTLDGVRAAENFAPAGLSGTSTPVLMFGYSGGARGIEFGAELAPTYAPELNIRGVAAGGVPTDMGATAGLLNGGPFAGLAFSAALGLDRAYPQLGISSYFPDTAFRQSISSLCAYELMKKYPFDRLQNHTVNGVWPLGVPAIAKTLDGLRAGTYGTPTAPMYLFTGANDEIASVPESDRLVADYCGRGLDVTYTKYPVAEHISAGFITATPAMDWLAQRLTGAPTAPTCGAPDNARIG
ncbi:lipase family protein [Nocardia transvalensis]|uniref:lipase family protein n=1 Tax=Nocardia transvalensis TaxID=37333 RepID=UPI001892D92B|nr:lipase family protein [Nocardia transvalensis]MBF6330618.1 hypothetical protein [Nocardia transvalensis]